jgi:hypothetical protein
MSSALTLQEMSVFIDAGINIVIISFRHPSTTSSLAEHQALANLSLDHFSSSQ